MVRDRDHRQWSVASPVSWPVDDTEESIVGSDLHQMTITNLRWGINEAAELYRVAGQSAPWHALTQQAVLGGMRADGSAYRTYPDLFVYPHVIDPLQGSFGLEADGPPVLIIEVLSESTHEADLDVQRGKGYTYARAGVREYLTLDPTGRLLRDGARGWRLDAGRYRAWEPEDDGRWKSAHIAVSFGLEGLLATVYTHAGQRMLHEGEVEQALAQRDAALKEERRLRAHDQQELERLRRLLQDRS